MGATLWGESRAAQESLGCRAAGLATACLPALAPDPLPLAPPAPAPPPPPSRQIQLDPALYPGEAGRTVWDKARHEREQRDALQVSRLGSKPVEVTIRWAPHVGGAAVAAALPAVPVTMASTASSSCDMRCIRRHAPTPSLAPVPRPSTPPLCPHHPPARLELDHQPAQWKLSPRLAATLGCKPQQSLPFVLQMLWGYIKAHNLYEVSGASNVVQLRKAALSECRDEAGEGRAARRRHCIAGARWPTLQLATAPPPTFLPAPNRHCPPPPQPTDKGTVTFRCDGALRELFGADAVELARAAEALKPHLGTPDPVELRYTVRWGPRGGCRLRACLLHK